MFAIILREKFVFVIVTLFCILEYVDSLNRECCILSIRELRITFSRVFFCVLFKFDGILSLLIVSVTG